MLVAAAVLAACGGTIRPPRARLTPKQIMIRSQPSIVQIRVFGVDGPAIGTGFAVAPDGRIATNLHVIDGALEAVVQLHDGTEYPVEFVVATDPAHDLAILRIPKRDVPALPLGDSDGVSPGDPVFAIGNPLGAGWTISDGLISAIRPVADGLTMLQISAPISRGSSGGPLLNVYGEVVGVATMVSSEGQNLNFGMPINYLKPLLARDDGESFETFAARSRARAEAGRRAAPRIERQVPDHPLSVLDGCSDEDIRRVAAEIIAAIEKGAPIYNGTCSQIRDPDERARARADGRCVPGDHEVCYRIYEGTALRLDHDLPQDCRGVRAALGDGLLRARTLDSYTEKAWAMRDAFDGLLAVIEKKLRR